MGMNKTLIIATALLASFLATAVVSASERGAYQVASAALGRAAGEVYAFPNPARQVPSVTFHAEVGDADGVQVSVYNVAGDLVHEGRLNGNPAIVQGASAYEYQWNLSDVASGSYVLIVRAQLGDGQDVIAKKAFTVIQ